MSEQQKNSFEKGLIKDVNPNKQPENSYLNAVNFVRLSSEGDYYSFTNEKGTELYCSLTEDFSVIGQFVLESDIILFLCKNDNSACQIGILDSNGVFTVKLDDTTNELDLDTDHPIDCTARVLINSNRVVYFVDNKNPNRTIDLDDVPTAGNIAKLSTLVPSSNFPTISNFLVKDSSTDLKCGAYQFAFRYLDNKGNITNVSIPSSLVSIGQNSTSSAYQYQGGYSDITSGKSITITIDNIDIDYQKLEIIAIYYNAENTLITNVTAQLTIESNTTIIHEYKGAILYDLTIEEVQGVTTNYSTAKCIEQKDGRLFISNLKENSTVEANLQNIANNIVLKYFIDTIAVNSYKDGNNTATKVGYKRGEVYSFAFGVVYKNGAKSFAYHIPAPDTLSGTTGAGTIINPADTGTNILGTYKSTLQYPSGQDYPNIANGYSSDNIRYHVMPTFEQEIPFTITDVNTGSINVLGIEPEFPAGAQADWDAIKDQIQGIFILRRSRDSAESTSIFSQGITNYMMDNFTVNTVGDEDALGATVTNGALDFRKYNTLTKYIVKAPFLGGIKLQGYFPDKSGVWDGSSSGNDALQTVNQPLEYTYIASDPDQEAINTTPINAIQTNAYGTDGTAAIGQLYKRLLVWYSPESELLPKVEANTFTKIKRVGQFEFTYEPNVRWNKSSYEREDNFGAGDGESEMLLKPLLWTYFYPTTATATGYSNTPAAINKNYYIPRNTSVLSTYETVNINNLKQEEFLLLETESTTLPDTEITRIKYKVQNVDAAGGSFLNDSLVVDNPLLKNIYELISENTSQYGSVSNQQYIICKYIVYDQDTTPDLDTFDGTDIYGGDIYITRVAFTNKTPIASKHYEFQAPNSWRNPAGFQTNSFGREYLDFRSVIEFYVESTKNTDLRHSITGGNVYYRFSDLVTTLTTDPTFIDDTKSYNNQYDFENRVQLFSSKSDITSTSFNHYRTRTIWSDQTILGELRDRYRDIRVNNFNDLPFNTGEIWDSFVFNNIFYLHTPKTLWKTNVNTIEQRLSDSTVGQVVLGTGGVFPVDLPPRQVLTQQSGYGGTISQWGGCNTPFGYIFPDALQGKVFLLNGEGLSEISAIGMTREFQDNLSVLETNYTGYRDNPFKYGDRGILSAYDFELKRWILTKNHEIAANRFTVSYDVLSKQWTSFHTYQPNVLISRDNRLYGLMNIENTGEVDIHQHNIGDYGVFYGNSVEDSILSIVVNKGFNDEKVFDNLVLDLDSSSTTKIQAYRGTGDTIQVYNHRQHTGVVNLVWSNTYGLIPDRDEARVQMLRNNYNIKVPLNSLISDNNAIFDTNGNLINSNIDQDKLFRDRIKGDFCIIQFNFNNSDNYKLTLNEINTIFRVYKR